MRTLTQTELEQVKKAITAKGLSSAEILLEIYDHYMSHLEQFDEGDFEGQLKELEERFPYSYCHSLQSKFAQASRKEIFGLQWEIFKTYFTWPRFVVTGLFLAFMIILWDTIDNRTKGLTLVIPLVFAMLLTGWIFYKSYRKVKEIKGTLQSQNTVKSSYLDAILGQFSLLTSSLNMLIFFPKIFGTPNFFDSTYFLAISFFLLFSYVAYTLTLFEAWKTKSKTALI